MFLKINLSKLILKHTFKERLTYPWTTLHMDFVKECVLTQTVGRTHVKVSQLTPRSHWLKGTLAGHNPASQISLQIEASSWRILLWFLCVAHDRKVHIAWPKSLRSIGKKKTKTKTSQNLSLSLIDFKTMPCWIIVMVIFLTEIFELLISKKDIFHSYWIQDPAACSG